MSLCLHMQVVIDTPSGADAADLAAEGVQLLSQAPPCCGSHMTGGTFGQPPAAGAVADLADRLGTTADGRLALRNLPEGKHKLFLPRVDQVRLQQAAVVLAVLPCCVFGCIVLIVHKDTVALHGSSDCTIRPPRNGCLVMCLCSPSRSRRSNGYLAAGSSAATSLSCLAGALWLQSRCTIH